MGSVNSARKFHPIGAQSFVGTAKRISGKALVVLFFTIQLAFSNTAEEGRKIAEFSDRNNRGFKGEYVESVLYLINANLDTVKRKTVSKTIERELAEDYSIIQFLEPPDIKGTGLLTYQNPMGDDHQWLYLPDLRRVKKIASKNKSGAFMGSEFAYEDLTGNTLNKFTYDKIGEEKFNDLPCYIVEKKPLYKNSGYTSIKMWIDKEQHLLLRQEFFDRKKSLLKIQLFIGWKAEGKVWRASQIEIENVQTKKKSSIVFHNRKIGLKFKDSDFSTRNLEKPITK